MVETKTRRVELKLSQGAPAGVEGGVVSTSIFGAVLDTSHHWSLASARIRLSHTTYSSDDLWGAQVLALGHRSASQSSVVIGGRATTNQPFVFSIVVHLASCARAARFVDGLPYVCVLKKREPLPLGGADVTVYKTRDGIGREVLHSDPLSKLDSISLIRLVTSLKSGRLPASGFQQRVASSAYCWGVPDGKAGRWWFL